MRFMDQGSASTQRMAVYEIALKHFHAHPDKHNLTANNLAALAGIQDVRSPQFSYAIEHLRYNFRVQLPYEQRAAQ